MRGLGALKPSYNAEASWYALGFWRPPDKDLKPGHREYNPYNWHSLAGFVRHMP